MVMRACSHSYSGGWGTKIAWTWEAEVAVSWDHTIMLQPGQQSKNTSNNNNSSSNSNNNNKYLWVFWRDIRKSTLVKALKYITFDLSLEIRP